jgi:hypothetical protein
VLLAERDGADQRAAATAAIARLQVPAARRRARYTAKYQASVV